MIFPMSIYLLENFMIWFFITVGFLSIICMYIFFINSSVEVYLYYFYFLAILNRSSMIMAEKISLEYDIKIFVPKAKSYIARPICYLFLMILHIYFHSSCMSSILTNSEWAIFLYTTLLPFFFQWFGSS